MPETMEMALRECGTPRILFAAAVSRRHEAVRAHAATSTASPATRPARSTGRPSGTIPPYNKAVVLGPERPREVARHLKELIGGSAEVAVVDINDIGGNILGSTLDKAGEQRLVRDPRRQPARPGAPVDAARRRPRPPRTPIAAAVAGLVTGADAGGAGLVLVHARAPVALDEHRAVRRHHDVPADVLHLRHDARDAGR